MLDSNPIPSPEISGLAEISGQSCDVLVVGLTQEGSLSSTLQAVNQETGGWIEGLVSNGEILGKKGELTLLALPADSGPRMLLVVGLGSCDPDRQSAFESGSMIVRRLGDRPRGTVSKASNNHRA